MIKYVVSILFLLFSGCSGKISDTGKLACVDFKERSTDLSIDLFKFKFIPLETTDSCLLSGIGQIEFINDKIYIIDRTNEMVFVFNINGEYIAQVGAKGNGPGEYIMPKTLHVDENKSIISIIDIAQSKIIHYDLETYKYISNQKIGDVCDCDWLASGDIVWYNRSGYNTNKREHFYLEITNQELVHQGYYYPADIVTGYGIGLGNRFHKYNGHTYLSIPFFSIVHEVTSQGVTPAYNVSFGKEQLPTREWLFTHLSNDQNYMGALLNSEYISAFNLNETDDYLATTYYANNNNCYIAFYNKETKCSYKYSAQEFMHLIGVNGLSPIIGVSDNYFVTALYCSDLKASSIKNKELRGVSETIVNDGNPVLCLFKIEEQ